MPRPFKGEINLDVRESTPDWGAFLADRAPQGAPNVLVVLYDDTGCAAWSPYGGRINMPTMQRLADNGLTYSQWHTTALCSPTRSTFLTGRNHHLNGYASISEAATGFPGLQLPHPAREWHARPRLAGRRVVDPYGPEDGYHLSKDLAAKAISFIRDAKQSEPDKPWYLWFCSGANHAPHHAPRTTSTSTRGCSTTGMRPTGSGSCPG
jgi:arylsulfatase A-like enzyme